MELIKDRMTVKKFRTTVNINRTGLQCDCLNIELVDCLNIMSGISEHATSILYSQTWSTKILLQHYIIITRISCHWH